MKHKNMISRLLILLFLFASPAVLAQQTMQQAQKKKKRQRDNRWTDQFGAAIGIGRHQFGASLQWYRLYALGESRRFKIGYGLRLAGVLGSDVRYTSSPPKLANDQNLRDTLCAESPKTFLLNAGFYASYDLHPRLILGANIDLVGISLGGNTDGILHSSDLPNDTLAVVSKPSMLNAYLLGKNSKGSIDAEIYFAYKINPKWRVKLGVQRLFNEQKTDEKYLQENDLYRSRIYLATIGVIWTPFIKEVNCPWFKGKKIKAKKNKQKGEL